jgi:N-acetylneuraminic acid mutarotase
MNFKHRDAEVVRLRNGSLLAIGGSEGLTKTGTRNVEILPARGDKWIMAAPMNQARISHASTMLLDGRVLVCGGQKDPTTFLSSCEIYDPSANKWSVTAPMKEIRATHHLRTLKDGRAIAIGGGTDISATPGVEIFNPATQIWSSAAPMLEPRWGFASTVLPNGKIVVAGGRVPAIKGASLADDRMIILRGVEQYDPTTNEWQSLPSMNVPRSMGIPNVELLSLPNGGLLFSGGRSYPAPYHGSSTSEYYDYRNNRWVMTSPMRTGRSYQASIVLKNGQVLAAGGRGPRFLPLSLSECFEPMNGLVR